MNQGRTIRGEAILDDIKAGLTDDELMAKYRLSLKGLQAAFQQLLSSGKITAGELYGRASLLPETDAIPNFNADTSTKQYPMFPIPIYELARPKVIGRVRFLSDKELGTVGIDAEVDETKTMIIFPEKFVDFEPFQFQGKCTWTSEEEQGQKAAEFTISEISEEGLHRLRKLILLLTMGD